MAILDVKNFGARGDGRRDDTNPIRQALAALGTGDTLRFPAGTYRVTGEIRPPSNCSLEFLGGSKLVQASHPHLVVLQGVENVQTHNMRLRHNGTNRHANPLRIDGSHDLYLFNTVIERTDAWSLYLLGGSHHIVLNGYTNLTGEAKSTNVDDGIDFAECHDVTLMNFDIRTNDDAISFKSWGEAGTHHIHVHNGVIRSRDSGISFGTELERDLYALLIENVQFVDSGVPLYLKLYDDAYGGVIHDVAIRNLSAIDTKGRGQRGIFAQKYDFRDRLQNVEIDGFQYSGPLEWDFIHLMRTRNLVIRNASCQASTVKRPARPTRNRWGLWLDNAGPDNRIEVTGLTGMGSDGRLQGSETVGNVIGGLQADDFDEVEGALAANQVWE